MHRPLISPPGVAGAVLLLGMLILAGPVRAQASADTMQVSLEGAIRRSLEVSPEVGARVAGEDYAAARHRLARASRYATEFNMTTAHAPGPGLDVPDPSVREDALYLDPDVRNDWEDLRPFNRFEFGLVQPIYTWGELSGNIRAAHEGVQVEGAKVDEKALDVALRAGETYYGALLAEELYRLADRANGIVDKAKVILDSLYQAGSADVDDADLFKLQIAEQEFKRRVVEVTQQRRLVRSGLARQLFADEGTTVLPEETSLQPIDFALDSLDVYYDQALGHRPEIRQAEAGLDARRALVGVARSAYFPKLFLGVNAKYSFIEGRHRQRNPYVSDPFLGNSLRAGLGMRLNLNFLQTKARVQQARANVDEVRYQLQGARQLVLFQVEEAYTRLVTASKGLETRDAAFKLSKEWLRTEQVNFDLDIGDPDNLVEAVQTSLELEAAYYQAIHDYDVAVLRLLKATGVLAQRAADGTLVD